MAIFREITLSFSFERVLTLLAAAIFMVGMATFAYIKDNTIWSIVCLLCYIPLYSIYIYMAERGNIFSGSSHQNTVLYNSPIMMSSGGAMNVQFRIENYVLEKVKEKNSTSSAMLLEPNKESKQRCKGVSLYCSQMRSGRGMNVPATLNPWFERSVMKKNNEKIFIDSAIVLEPKIEQKRRYREALLNNQLMGSSGGMNVPLTDKLRIERSVTRKNNGKTSIGSAMGLKPKIEQKRRFQDVALYNSPMRSGGGMNVPYFHKLRIEKSIMEKDKGKISIGSTMILEPKIEQKRRYQEATLYNPSMRSSGGIQILTHKLWTEKTLTKKANEKTFTNSATILESTTVQKLQCQETELCNSNIGSGEGMNMPLTTNLRVENFTMEKVEERPSTSSDKILEPKTKTKQPYCLHMRSCGVINEPVSLNLRVENFVTEKDNEKTSTCSAIVLEPKAEQKRRCEEVELCNPPMGSGGAMNVPPTLNLRIKKTIMKKDERKSSTKSTASLKHKIKKKKRCQKTVLYNRVIDEFKRQHAHILDKGGKKATKIFSKRRHSKRRHVSLPSRIEKFATEKAHEKTSTDSATILEPKIEQKRKCQEVELCNPPIGNGGGMNAPLSLNLSRIEKFATEKAHEKTSTNSVIILEPKIEHKQRCQEVELCNSSMGSGREMNVPLSINLRFKKIILKKEEKKTSTKNTTSLKLKIKKKKRYQKAVLYNRAIEEFKRQHAHILEEGGKKAIKIFSKRRHVSLPRFKRKITRLEGNTGNSDMEIC